MQTVWSPRAGDQPFPSPGELLGSGEQEGGGSDGCSLGTEDGRQGQKSCLWGKKSMSLRTAFPFCWIFFGGGSRGLAV